MGVMRRLKDVAKAIDGEMAAHAGVDNRLALMGPAGEVRNGLVKLERGERIKDPAEWERVRRAELAPRDAAREPYLAPARPPLRIGRFVTRGKTQAQDVAAHLAACGLAARPDLVYGLYRVPDRIRPSAGPEGGRVVEWDIVHAATAPLPPADAPADVFFDAGATWVARRIGEPSILDEDLALAYLAQAGIGPELTLGIARHVTIDPRGDDDEASDSRMTARVRGVHAFHPRSVGGSVAADLAAAAPLDLPTGPPAGVHVELVNWDVIARAVYAEGRERWAACQTKILKAELGREIRPRAPVPAGNHGGGRLKRTFNKVVDVFDFFDPDTSNEPSLNPPRYCWPPAVQRRVVPRGVTREKNTVCAAFQATAAVEKVRRHKLLDIGWEPGGDGLTPTMKLKRRPIAEKYAEDMMRFTSASGGSTSPWPTSPSGDRRSTPSRSEPPARSRPARTATCSATSSR